MSVKHYKYLKERSYYEDLYDHRIVDNCRRYDYPYSGKIAKKMKGKHGEAVNQLLLYFAKGGLHQEREETISEWMTRDKERDEHHERVQMSMNCDICGKKMEILIKSLEIDFLLMTFFNFNPKRIIVDYHVIHLAITSWPMSKIITFNIQK